MSGLWVWLLTPVTSSEQNHPVCVCDCLLSLSMLSWRFTCIGAVSEFPSFLGLKIPHCVCRPCFAHLFIHRQTLGCLLAYAAAVTAYMTTAGQVAPWLFSVLQVHAHMGDRPLVWWLCVHSYCLPKPGPVCIPTSRARGLQFSTSTCSCCFLGFW